MNSTAAHSTAAPIVHGTDALPQGSTGRRGLSARYLLIELRRLARNPATVIFTVVMPIAFYLIFGAGQSYAGERLAHGTVGGAIMVNMALYGAITAATIGGALVALERTLGWSRQLQITPLRAGTYILTKVLVALTLSALAVAAVFVTGRVSGAVLDGGTWAAAAAAIWLGSALFAAYGLAFGYLVPGGNGMSIAGPLLALLAFPGGLFGPLTAGSFLEVFGRFTPMRGLAQIVSSLVTGESTPWWAPVNAVAWTLAFAALALWGFRRDTARMG